MSDRSKLLIGGAVLGLIAAMLAFFGNPENMAICIACFLRDTAGSLKFHNAAPVQYFRPEIVGLVLGSFVISLVTKEYRSTAGSSPVIRFFLGMVMVIGALVFLGCPTRMVIRMAAGDLTAWIGLIGFVAGVGTGALFLKKGFSLGRNYETKKVSGMAFPVVLLILFIMSITTAYFVSSTKGPGSKHAAVLISLVAGLIFGALAQRIRMCFGGAVRDAILLKNFDLLSIIGGFFVVLLAYNLISGTFKLSMTGQPVAHAQHIWNILGLYVVGFASVLLGGCPLRQLILAGQGSNDSVMTVLGMFFGAAVAHNWNLASAAAAPNVVGGPSLSGKIAVFVCVVVLFVVGFAGIINNKKVVLKDVK